VQGTIVDASKTKLLRKILLRFFLVTLPAMSLTAYGVSWGAEYFRVAQGVVVHPNLHVFVLITALWVVVWATYGDVIQDVKDHSHKVKQDSESEQD
jgi:hypothetical protein